MTSTIRKLAGTSVLLTLAASTSFFIGSRYDAPAAKAGNELARQFAGDPGDGWMLFGGFLLIVAVALAFAGAKLWSQES
jgi:hypothetical protein